MNLPHNYRLVAHDDPVLDAVTLVTGYTRRAFRRQLLLATAVFTATVIMAGVVMAFSSPVYTSEARIVVNTNLILGSGTAARRHYTGSPTDPDPLATVVEMMKSRESLTKLMDTLGLVKRWTDTRGAFGRWLDKVTTRLFGPPGEHEQREALLEVLDRKITVRGENDIITVTVNWHEPEGAVLLARAIIDNFAQEQHAGESGQYQEQVSVLEKELARADDLLAAEAARFAVAAERANAASGMVLKRRFDLSQPDLEQIATLEQELEKKREALRRLEAAHDASVGEVREALNNLRARLGPNHPDVREAERTLVLQSEPPNELRELRASEAETSTRLTRVMPSATATGLLQTLTQVATTDPALETARESYARASGLRAVVATHLSEARSAMATAEAAFAYKYSITQPPQLPRKPTSPDGIQVAIASVVAGCVLAFVLAIIRDVSSGRIQEPWQITRFVGLPVIGTIKKKWP